MRFGSLLNNLGTTKKSFFFGYYCDVIYLITAEPECLLTKWMKTIVSVNEI